MINDDIRRLSARKTAEAIARRKISSVEAVSASLERIEETAEVTNSFEEVFEEALDLAAQADRDLAAGRAVGPFHGVPMAMKVNHDIDGRTTTGGAQALLGRPVATESSPAADRLRESGAILVGRTRMSPGGFRWSVQSDAYGLTRNPWDPSVTPGGSSGGAAAALAVGAVPAVIGNDIGGSIRYPLGERRHGRAAAHSSSRPVLADGAPRRRDSELLS